MQCGKQHALGWNCHTLLSFPKVVQQYGRILKHVYKAAGDRLLEKITLSSLPLLTAIGSLKPNNTPKQLNIRNLRLEEWKTDVTESDTLIVADMTIHKLTAPQQHRNQSVTVIDKRGKKRGGGKRNWRLERKPPEGPPKKPRQTWTREECLTSPLTTTEYY